MPVGQLKKAQFNPQLHITIAAVVPLQTHIHNIGITEHSQKEFGNLDTTPFAEEKSPT